MDKAEKLYRYSQRELSAFCLQIALLLEAAVPLDEGLEIMAADAACAQEKELLLYLSQETAGGLPFYQALEAAGTFPAYMVHAAQLGQQTGTLERLMKELAAYYEKEYRLLVSVKNALTYPILMVVMLLVVLFVLFTKVMPVFEQVYAQLGASMPPAALSAIRMGGIFSGGALVLFVLAALGVAMVWAQSRRGKASQASQGLINWIKNRSKIAQAIAGRRFTAVLSLVLKSGMEIDQGMEMAARLADHPQVSEKIRACAKAMEEGSGYYQAMKDTGLFSGFHLQMIQVGTRSGHLDQIMDEISSDYEQTAEQEMNNLLARFEPTIVAVLAVAVGLVLLAVMLPLAGMLSAM